tara:strand:- start:332 stop:796 length:465 start_codon:yes stop_codon:yes gene_type:complete
MKLVILIIFVLNFLNNVLAEDLIWESYGTRKVIDNLKLDENSWITTISNEFIFTTNKGTYGTGTCSGSVNKQLEQEEKAYYRKANVYCEVIDQNENRAILDFSFKRKADSVEGVSQFIIKGGSGPYASMKNTLCIGAFLKLRNDKFIWKGKCKL